MHTYKTQGRAVYSVLFLAVFLIALVFVSICFSACSPEKHTIRIGVNAWPPCELWYVAEQQGFFAGMDVDIVRFSTWTDNMKSLPLGDIDITHSTYFNALYYRDKGKGGKIILKSDTIEGGDGLVVGSHVKDGPDLKGRSIAVETATDEHFLLYNALERFGLSEEDVSLVSMTSVDASKAFISGEVDACFTYEPYLSEAAKGGNGKIVYTTTDIPDTMIDVLVASDEFLAKYPNDAKRLVDAYYRAQEWTKAHPDEAFALMGKNERMGASDFGSFYSSFTFFSKEHNVDNFSSGAFKATLASMRDFLMGHGFVQQHIALDDMYWSKAVK